MVASQLSLILLLLIKIIDVTNGQMVNPTISNSTGDYYDITNTTTTNKLVICSSDKGCHIRCGSTNSCQSAQISGSPSWLYLECTAIGACTNMSVVATPSQSATIICQSAEGSACSQVELNLTDTPIVDVICNNSPSNTTTYSDGNCYHSTIRAPNSDQVRINCIGRYDCYGADFIVTNVAEVNITCSGSGNCYDMILQAENAENVIIDCDGELDCYRTEFYLDNVEKLAMINGNDYGSLAGSKIYASNAGSLDINCNAGRSCSDLFIYPPYTSQYVFSLFCIYCNDLMIFIPSSNSAVDSYMELDCNRYDDRLGCDVNWVCQDIYQFVAVTSVWWSSSHSRFVCNNQNCCPWTDYNNVVPPDWAPGILPNAQIPTRNDSSGEYYDFTNDTTWYKTVNCLNSAGCFINCPTWDSCENMIIYAALTSYLEITCNGSYSCYDLYLTQGPIDGEAVIHCTSTSYSSCNGAAFWMERVNKITINCKTDDQIISRSGACRSIYVGAERSDIVSINCIGDESCKYGEFYVGNVTTKASIIGTGKESLSFTDINGVNAAKLNVTCANYRACYHANIYPPYVSIADFALNCVGRNNSYNCQGVDIFIPNKTVAMDNYMQLICSPNNSTCSDLEWICGCKQYEYDWICPSISDDHSKTQIIYDSASESYHCKDGDCCPWPSEEVEPSISPVVVTVILSVILVVVIGGFIFYKSKKKKKESVQMNETEGDAL